MPVTTFRPFSPEPVVRIEKAFTSPFKNVVATAKTCYSSKGIVKDTDIKGGFENLARSLYQAGHHTTFQHAHFQFSLENVSRQFIWSFLHSHPFYNSEQVSQRYVPVRNDSYAVPPLADEALEIYHRTIAMQMNAYSALIQMLYPLVEEEYRSRFPFRDLTTKKNRRAIEKKCMEIARYVLPVATLAYLYHTVSGVTLLRYYRLCEQLDAPLEQRIVIGKMVEALREFDPDYETVIQEPIELDSTPESQFFAAHQEFLRNGSARAFTEEFDKDLNGRVSRLIDYKVNNEQVLAQSVREVLGVPREALSDDEAIEMVLNPARNRLFGEALNLTTVSKLGRTMFHPSYTFRKKLSHTADSQDQRHRMTPASRPVLTAHFCDEPDYITPEILREDDALHRRYVETMDRTWDGIRELLRHGVEKEFAFYLLPNAVAVRFTESSDLLNLHHKHTMRLCYLAQEEIWRASLDEAMQIQAINPRIGKYLLPPCTQRSLAGTTPPCPEGPRYCGVPVWRLPFEEYSRKI